MMNRKRVCRERETSRSTMVIKAIERLGGFATLDELICETQLPKAQVQGAVKYLMHHKGIVVSGYAFRRLQEVSAVSFGTTHQVMAH